MIIYSSVYVDFELTKSNKNYFTFVNSYKIPLVLINTIIVGCTLTYCMALKYAIHENKRNQPRKTLKTSEWE
jgi:hypothetical protein